MAQVRGVLSSPTGRSRPRGRPTTGPGMNGVFPTPTLSLISSQGAYQTEVRGGVFAAGLSVPLPRMAAKSKSRRGPTRTTRNVEDEEDEGEGKDKGKGCVPWPYSLLPTPYFLLPNY